LLERGNAFTDAALKGWADGREGQVCLFLGRRGFEDGCHYFLGEWGGEVIARAVGKRCPELLKLGIPTIVRVRADLRWSMRLDPDVRKLLVGIRLQLDDAYCAVHFAEPVPATHIIGMWHSTDPEYRDLPGDLPPE
jgi:hypothetical protein